MKKKRTIKEVYKKLSKKKIKLLEKELWWDYFK